MYIFITKSKFQGSVEKLFLQIHALNILEWLTKSLRQHSIFFKDLKQHIEILLATQDGH